jgi:hypothetical protein
MLVMLGRAGASWRLQWPEEDTVPTEVCAHVPPMTKGRTTIAGSAGRCTKKPGFWAARDCVAGFDNSKTCGVLRLAVADGWEPVFRGSGD